MKTGYRFGATVISLLCSIVCLVLALIPITITQARAGGDRTAMLRAPVLPNRAKYSVSKEHSLHYGSAGEVRGDEACL